MSVLTVRITEQENKALAKRARKEGVTMGALVREWIRQQPVTMAADLLEELDPLMGDEDLRIDSRR